MRALVRDVRAVLVALALACWLLLPVSSLRASSAELSEVDRLVQQEKYAEALAQVEGLLKARPGDKSLLELQGELRKLAGSSGSGSTPPASPASAPAALSLDDRLELATLQKLAASADAAEPGSGQRRQALEQVLARSSALGQARPQLAAAHVLRARAALELDKPRDGWEAGQHLRRLPEAESETVLDVLASLNAKGWLKLDEKGIQQLEGQARQQEAEILLLALWKGTWAGERKSEGSSTENSLTIAASDNNAKAPLSVQYSSTRSSSGVTGGAYYHSTMRIEAPGQATYSSNYTSEYQQNNHFGEAPVELRDVQARDQILTFQTAGTLTQKSSDGSHQVVSLDASYAYFYDPKADLVYQLAAEEAKLPPDQLAVKVQQPPTPKSQRVVLKRQGASPPERQQYLDLMAPIEQAKEQAKARARAEAERLRQEEEARRQAEEQRQRAELARKQAIEDERITTEARSVAQEASQLLAAAKSQAVAGVLHQESFNNAVAKIEQAVAARPSDPQVLEVFEQIAAVLDPDPGPDVVELLKTIIDAGKADRTFKAIRGKKKGGHYECTLKAPPDWHLMMFKEDDGRFEVFLSRKGLWGPLLELRHLRYAQRFEQLIASAAGNVTKSNPARFERVGDRIYHIGWEARCETVLITAKCSWDPKVSLPSIKVSSQ